jgi:hypothetical protein
MEVEAEDDVTEVAPTSQKPTAMEKEEKNQRPKRGAPPTQPDATVIESDEEGEEEEEEADVLTDERITEFRDDAYDFASNADRKSRSLAEFTAEVNKRRDVRPFTVDQAEAVFTDWAEDETCPFSFNRKTKRVAFLQ